MKRTWFRPTARKRPHDGRWAAFGAAGLLTLFSCATPELVPLQATANGQVRVAASGVEVVADATPETRPWQLPHALTPVRLTIHNASRAPIFIRLEDIRLTGSSERLLAIAPDTIEPRRRNDSLGMSPSSPLLGQQQTSIGGSSRAGRVETVTFEPGFHTVFQHHVADHDPERAALIDGAFAGGQIRSGETLEGLVYFRRPSLRAGELKLQVGVRVRPGDGPSSVLEITYAVRS